MATARLILSNTLIQVLGKVFLAVLGLVTSKLLATYLRVEERGLYEYTYNFLAFLGIAADMGLYTIAIREMSKHKDDMPKIIGNILSIRNTLSIGVFFIALLMVLFIPGLQLGLEFTLAVVFAGVATVFALLNGTLTSVLQVHYKMLHATIAQVLGKVVIVVTMALGMFLIFQKQTPGYEFATEFWAFQWLFIAGVVGNMVLAGYTWYHARKLVSISYRFDFGYWKHLFQETFLYGLALILGTLYFKVDILLLGFLLPASGVPVEETAKFQIGLYSAAIKVVEIFAVLPLFFLNALLPTLSRFLEEKKEKVQELIQYSFDFLYLLACPLAFGGYAIAYHIVHITNSPAYLSRLSEGFVGSDMALQIVIFTLIFSFLGLLFNFLLVAQNKQKVLIVINGGSLIFNTVANIIFIPKYGIMAAAWTTVVTEILVFFFSFLMAKQYTTFSLHLGRTVKITISGLLMAFAVISTSDYLLGLFGTKLGLLLVMMEAGLIYGFSILGLRVVNREMLALMKKA